MKKYMILLLAAALFTACRSRENHDGTYISHIKGEYSVVDDTLIVQDTVIINHTGYQKIRDGVLQCKAFKIHSWTLHSPDAPVMLISDGKITLGKTIYEKLP